MPMEVPTDQTPVSASSSNSTPVSNGVLTRIRRTLSTRSYFTSKSRSPSYSSTPNISDEPSSEGIPQRTPGLTPFEKFVRTLKRKRDAKTPPLEFPPSHWEANDLQELCEEPEAVTQEPLPDEALTGNGSTPGGEPSNAGPPEPATIAQRIQTMLSSFPPFFVASLPTPASTEATTSACPSSSEGTQRVPIPLLLSSDPKFVSLLSSPTAMSGSTDKTRSSVWSILDHIKEKFPGQTPPAESHPVDKGKRPEAETQSSQPTDGDNTSVMLYTPLLPDDSSEVEIARSEIIEDPELSPLATHSSKEGSRLRPSSNSPQNEVQSEPHTKQVWVPSSTKLSLQVNWWGYRLYLPPPVLMILDNKQLESAKRAAIITTALKWALDHIPTLVIPPQMRPAISVLKGLVPYLGYVGGFVAWSWSAIKTFDKGNGVVVTATWLLPVALIPGTWEDDEYPEVIEQHRQATANPSGAS